MDERLPSPASSPLPHDQTHAHASAARILQNFYHQQQQHGGFLHPALTRFTAAVAALPPHLQAHEQFRSRSGSLLSLGSTASSHRPERSPSRESSCSQESLPRASPVGYMPESPSPSPPNESSKLFGLLKGTAQTPFSGLFNKPQDLPRRSNGASPAAANGDDVTRAKASPGLGVGHLQLNGATPHLNGSAKAFQHPHLRLPPQHLLPPPSPSEKEKLEAYWQRSHAFLLDSRAEACRRSNSISVSRPSRQTNHRRRTSSSRSVAPAGARTEDDDSPIDLSVKRPRCATLSGYSNVRRFSPPPLDPLSAASMAVSHNGVVNAGDNYLHHNELKRKYSQLRAMTSHFSAPAAASKPLKPVLEPISPPLRSPSRDAAVTQRSPSDSRAPSRGSVASQGSNDEGSILRSILVGENSSDLMSGPSRPPSARSELSTGMAVSPSPALSDPASPANSIVSRLLAGSPSTVEGNQRVCIAKKTLFPVRARITNWLQHIVKFAKQQDRFSSLAEADQLALLETTWARLLVIVMAEHHFEFAVCPEAGSVEGDAGTGVGSLEVPTMKGVETVQNFIQTLQSLSLDSDELNLLKMVVLFEAGAHRPPF